MGYSMIGITVTQKCTAKCAICCSECGIDKTSVIDKDALIEYLSTCKDIEAINTIGFSGGEVFLYYDFLLEMVKFVAEMGKKSTVLSNGFWADTFENTINKLALLKNSGVTQVALSYDEFHEDYIPLKNVRNYIKASKELNMRPVIQTIVTSQPHLEWINLLGPDLSDAYINFISCYPVGEAKKRNFSFYDRRTPTSGLTCRYSGTLLVQWDGSIVPCCSPYINETALQFGSIKQQTVMNTIERANQNIIFRYLRKYGFDFFIRLIRENKLDIDIPKYVISSCELCALFFNSENIKKFFPYILHF